MKSEELAKIYEKMVMEEVAIRDNKGREYAGDDDQLANFKKEGAELGVDPKVILLIYMNKHFSAIRSYVKNGKSFSNEHIFERIKDARVYLWLLRALVEEEFKLNPCPVCRTTTGEHDGCIIVGKKP